MGQLRNVMYLVDSTKLLEHIHTKPENVETLVSWFVANGCVRYPVVESVRLDNTMEYMLKHDIASTD